ncbi:hypothetical protein V5O48_012256 [Marasmius crinis-equi]|uniref:Cytochrome P450 n=1 Tax=Marasmius crinis-equi TaxID=585013 RepID=A0ABR3F3C2_9AGAR
MPDLLFTENYGDNEFGWQKTFGRTYRMKGCMGEDRLFSSDPLVMKTIFNNRLFGKSLYHRNIAAARLAEECSPSPLCDVYEILQNATTDGIAEVVMGHAFNAVETGGDEISKNHHNVIAISSIKSKSALLGDSILSLFPSSLFMLAANYLPAADFVSIKRYRRVMNEWSEKLLKEKSNNLKLGIEDADLLSVVVQTNESQSGGPTGLTQQEVKDQIPSILVAGQDTTGNIISFALYEFAKCPEWQERVRTELRGLRKNEYLKAAAYEKLVLLNAHVKETNRLYSTLPHTYREALEDTVLPLSQPITTTDGRQITDIPIKKGQVVYAGIASYHRNTDVWGEDAEVFDPLRWVDERATTFQGAALGPYANLATFLGGPHTCLGWRLAILETQILLAELVSKFRFEVDDDAVIRTSIAITLQPVSEKGVAHLPLRVTALEQ